MKNYHLLFRSRSDYYFDVEVLSFNFLDECVGDDFALFRKDYPFA
jgi:hypothetical protein